MRRLVATITPSRSLTSQPSNSSFCFHQRPASLRVLQWLKKVPILAYQAVSPGRCSRPCSLARSQSVITPQILNYSPNATIAQHVRYANTYCAQPSPAPSWCASFQWPWLAITEHLCDHAHTDRLACLNMIRSVRFLSLRSKYLGHDGLDATSNQ